MDRFDKTDWFFVGVIVGVIVLACAVIIYDNSVTRSVSQLEQEAIAHGFADYLVDTNKNVTFQWKK